MTRLFILILSVCLCNTAYTAELSHENPFKIPKLIPYEDRKYGDIHYVDKEILIVVDNSLKSATSTFFLLDVPIEHLMKSVSGKPARQDIEKLQKIKDEINKHWKFKIENYLSKPEYLSLPDYPAYRIGESKEWKTLDDNIGSDPGMTLHYFKYLYDVFYADSIKMELEDRLSVDSRYYENTIYELTEKYYEYCNRTKVDAYSYMFKKYAVKKKHYYFIYSDDGKTEQKRFYTYMHLEWARNLNNRDYDILLQELISSCDAIHKLDAESDRYKYKEPNWNEY